MLVIFLNLGLFSKQRRLLLFQLAPQQQTRVRFQQSPNDLPDEGIRRHHFLCLLVLLAIRRYRKKFTTGVCLRYMLTWEVCRGQIDFNPRKIRADENAISPTEKVVNEYKKYRKRAHQRVPKEVYAFSQHRGLLVCTERICKRHLLTRVHSEGNATTNIFCRYSIDRSQ